MGFLSDVWGALTGGSSTDAAELSANASQAAIDEQRRQFDIAMGLQQGNINFQNSAQSSLAQLLGLSPTSVATPGINPGAPSPYSGFSFGGPNNGGSHVGAPTYMDRGGSRPGFVNNRTGQTAGLGQGAPPPGGVGGSILDSLRNTPGYQFQVDEAIRNANVGAAGRGQFFSGAAGDELNSRLRGAADNTYNNRVNQLLAAANGGSSAQVASNQAINQGANIGNLLQNQGNARASGVVGQANQLNTLINGAITAFGAG